MVELQNATVTNPLDKAVQFRTEQNRLQRGGLGAAGVSYVPPEPELSADLMQHLMALANQRPSHTDALAHVAALSFAFVFIHPFMDGNGRLSRFLIQHCLGQSGQLPAGFLLPLSVAMNKHEDQYLQALTAFSKPARALCDVTWAGDDNYSHRWKPGADLWFRCMDLTEAVVFTLDMAKSALDIHLSPAGQHLQGDPHLEKSLAPDSKFLGASLLANRACPQPSPQAKNRQQAWLLQGDRYTEVARPRP